MLVLNSIHYHNFYYFRKIIFLIFNYMKNLMKFAKSFLDLNPLISYNLILVLGLRLMFPKLKAKDFMQII